MVEVGLVEIKSTLLRNATFKRQASNPFVERFGRTGISTAIVVSLPSFSKSGSLVLPEISREYTKINS
jgi:hypothetical protein